LDDIEAWEIVRSMSEAQLEDEIPVPMGIIVLALARVLMFHSHRDQEENMKGDKE